jgi:hypothetical protein
VDGTRNQLLAGTRLAKHQDVGLGARGLLQQLENLRHCRAVADDVLQREGRLQLLAQVAILERQPSLAECPLHHDRQLVDREILRQIVERAVLDRCHRRLDGREGGDDDNRQRGIQLLGPAQESQAVDPGHLEVGEEKVRSLGLE